MAAETENRESRAKLEAYIKRFQEEGWSEEMEEEYDGHIDVIFHDGDKTYTEPSTGMWVIFYLKDEDMWEIRYANRTQKKVKADTITFGGHTELGLCASFAHNPLREEYGSKTCKVYDIFTEEIKQVRGNPQTGDIEVDFLRPGRSRNSAAYGEREVFNIPHFLFH